MTIPISIIMPIFNGIEFFEQSLLSIINQTHKHWELIVGINGVCENSETEELANKIVNNHTNYDIYVKYYNTIGKSASLNKMICDCKYDYIALIDVDDIWLPSKLEYQIPYIGIYDVIGTYCQYFGDAYHNPKIPFGDLKDFNFLSYNPIINSSVIIKKELAKWNEHTIVEDYDLWLNLFYNHNKTFYNLDKCLVLHRLHKNSAFNNINDKYVFDLKQKYIIN